LRPPSSAAADRAAVARSGFPTFVELANRQQFGAGYVHGRHQRVIAEAIDALYHGEILTCLVSAPPGSMKSRTGSALAPAWIWSLDQGYKFMRASYDAGNAGKLATDTRELCKSKWYVDRWGEFVLDRHPYRPSGAGEYWTLSDGFSMCSSVESGRFVGRHAHMMIVDDPVKGQDVIAADPNALKKARAWFASVAETRGMIGFEQRMLVIAQRFHDQDLNGLLIERLGGDPKFAHVMLPWHYDPVRAYAGDWRAGMPAKTELFDDPKTRHAVSRALLAGEDNPIYQAQYQQNPTAARSDIFPEDTFLTLEGMPRFEDCPATAITVDPTNKGNKANDFCSVDVWGYWRGHFICYYSEWAKRDALGNIELVRRTRERFPTTFVVVESNNAGPIIIGMMQKEGISGVVGVNASGGIDGQDKIKWTRTNDNSKQGRALAASYYFKARRVHFDHDAPWFKEKRRYMVQFPHAQNDDPVDTAVMGVLWLAHQFGGGKQFTDAMAVLEGDTVAEKAAAKTVFKDRAARGHEGSPDQPRELTFAERCALSHVIQDEPRGPVLGLPPDALFE
jgi:phage terminase large subunit-like protein